MKRASDNDREEHTDSVPCISCDAMTVIRRNSEKASALCPCCGAIFQTNEGEIRRWQKNTLK